MVTNQTEALYSQVSNPPFFGGHKENPQLTDPEIANDLRLIALTTWEFLQKNADSTTGLPFDRVELRHGETHLRKITSPSNIGLALLSCVAATELGFVDREQAQTQMELLLNSILTLKTKHGLFVNWHHTDTSQAVEYWPSDTNEKCKIEEFISSVDNAWLAVGLLIASDHFSNLKPKIKPILDQMNFKILFDEARGSFAGGIHQTGELTAYHFPSTYLSEARILYYISYLLNQIDGETLSKYLENFPNSSYGGSIFETLMPLLVFDEQELPVNAILQLIALQQEAGQEHGYWGFSPCDDPGENYKEFGIGAYQTNGFEVVTPHALFLALPYAPTQVLEILQKMLAETNAWTSNGFVDAVNVKSKITSDTWLFLDQAMLFLAICHSLGSDGFRKKIDCRLFA